MGAGRYAPSPTGDLHIGNIRTAVLALALAQQTQRDFILRVEDLDRVRSGSADQQITDLRALGFSWKEPVIYQSQRLNVYNAVIADLQARGIIYECYCSRKDILLAASAPHAAPGAYPGVCRDLSSAKRAEHRARIAQTGRIPALRLRSAVKKWQVKDRFVGDYIGEVDDFVLRRTDGVVAYNLAVVVDDAYSGIDQVCRGNDLLASAPRQAYLAHLLGLPVIEYAHVPLVINRVGKRIAKRDGAVSLRNISVDNFAETWGVIGVLKWIAESVGVKPMLLNSNYIEAKQILDVIVDNLDWAVVNKGAVTFIPPTV